MLKIGQRKKINMVEHENNWSQMTILKIPYSSYPVFPGNSGWSSNLKKKWKRKAEQTKNSTVTAS